MYSILFKLLANPDKGARSMEITSTHKQLRIAQLRSSCICTKLYTKKYTIAKYH